MSEINKQQIAEVKEAMAKAIRLCERLARSLRSKGNLQQWEKTALMEHNDIISACNKSRFLLDCLPAVQVIELESAPTELLPPSAPTSVAETDTLCCDHCLEETANPVKVGDESLCVVCNNERESAEAKKKFEAEENERQEAFQRKLARVAELQAKKDKRSTEMSQANKQTLADLKEQVALLESIGRRNLDQKGKQQLTRFKHRIAQLETDSVSTGGTPTELTV
jgi:hypothetical protein